MRHLEKKWQILKLFKAIKSQRRSIVSTIVDKTKNCMHNKCMGLYGNLAVFTCTQLMCLGTEALNE